MHWFTFSKSINNFFFFAANFTSLVSCALRHANMRYTRRNCRFEAFNSVCALCASGQALKCNTLANEFVFFFFQVKVFVSSYFLLCDLQPTPSSFVHCVRTICVLAEHAFPIITNLRINASFHSFCIFVWCLALIHSASHCAVSTDTQSTKLSNVTRSSLCCCCCCY